MLRNCGIITLHKLQIFVKPTDVQYFCVMNCILLSYVVTRYLTNSMEQSPSWEHSNHWATQEITRLLWSPRVHYLVHKSLTLVLILTQMNLVNNI